MNIDKLVLVGYLRLRLRQIDRLEYTPKKKTQVILGSNGSGKSSVIRELSPLPALAANYRKGGSKEIWISHNNASYYLVSSFTEEGNFYDFYVNEENLNPGRTLTVYRELVKQHFNYTNEVHELLTHQTSFHEFSVNERRNWFMKLSDVDYTYAFKYFQKLKERARDLQGAIKQAQARLAEEQSKQLNKEEEDKLRLEIGELNTELRYLLESRVPIAQQDKDPSKLVLEVERQLAVVIASLFNLLQRHEQRNCLESSYDLRTLLSIKQTEFSNRKQEIATRLEHAMKFQKQIEELSGIGNCSLDEIVQDIAKLKEENEKLAASFSFDFIAKFPDKTAHASIEMCNSIHDAISSVFERLELLPKPVHQVLYSPYILPIEKKEFEDLEKALDICTKEKEKALAVVKEQQRLKEASKIECPSCKNVWSLNYDALIHEQAEKRAVKLEEAINKELPKYEEKKKFLQQCNELHTLHNELGQIIKHSRILEPFWSYVYDKHLYTGTASYFASVFQKLRSDLTTLLAIERNNGLIADKERIKKILEAANQRDKSKLEKELEQENEKIAQLQNQNRELKLAIDLLIDDIDLKEEIQEHYEMFQEYYRHREEYYQLGIKDSIMRMIDELINSLRLSISQKERQISQIEIRKALIASFEENLAKTKEDYELIQLAIQSLSPSQGLIARGMSGFIDGFVQDINNFISKIWTYPLAIKKIVPNSEDNLDLDYKFEVDINHTGDSPDISKTSKGQQEILNLAFVLISMKYLGLENFPIFLDEFAVNMDESHRSAAYSVIEYLINSTNFSQIYLISHYAEGYSSLSDTEILVLCENNIVIPKHLTYNSHAVIN